MAQIDPAQLARSATAATKLLKALANRNRLLILCQLSEGEMRVGELGQRIGLSPSALSQHLASLKRLGVVGARREARAIHYRLVKGPAQRLMMTLVDIYCSPSATERPSSDKRSGRRAGPAS